MSSISSLDTNQLVDLMECLQESENGQSIVQDFKDSNADWNDLSAAIECYNRVISGGTQQVSVSPAEGSETDPVEDGQLFSSVEDNVITINATIPYDDQPFDISFTLVFKTLKSEDSDDGVAKDLTDPVVKDFLSTHSDVILEAFKNYLDKSADKEVKIAFSKLSFQLSEDGMGDLAYIKTEETDGNDASKFASSLLTEVNRLDFSSFEDAYKGSVVLVLNSEKADYVVNSSSEG